jgi:NhaP-type Na+/H+ or K+/H+ antiporter
LFIVGTCGALGTDDLLACFVAGNALNWDGQYLAETEKRHDEVNSCIDVLLNFGGFMYIGTIIPWSDFNDPNGTGLTYPRLIGLGVLVLMFRRIPAIFATYKLYPEVCKDWKEALFMGYFGPIGIGAVFYVEHTKHLFPKSGEALTVEENVLTRVMVPVVYWLVLFSIIVHGLSIPALNAFLKWRGVAPVEDEHGPIEVTALSEHEPVPKNARRSSDPKRRSFVVNNRFSRSDIAYLAGPVVPQNWPQQIYVNDPNERQGYYQPAIRERKIVFSTAPRPMEKDNMV